LVCQAFHRQVFAGMEHHYLIRDLVKEHAVLFIC
jgi:hypothetical protein